MLVHIFLNFCQRQRSGFFWTVAKNIQNKFQKSPASSAFTSRIVGINCSPCAKQERHKCFVLLTASDEVFKGGGRWEKFKEGAFLDAIPAVPWRWHLWWAYAECGLETSSIWSKEERGDEGSEWLQDSRKPFDIATQLGFFVFFFKPP